MAKIKGSYDKAVKQLKLMQPDANVYIYECPRCGHTLGASVTSIRCGLCNTAMRRIAEVGV